MRKFYGIEDEDREELPSIEVDRNDIGWVSLHIRNLPVFLTPGMGSVWFDRSEAFDLAVDILKQLSMYPEDNAARVSRGLECCCKNYLEGEDEHSTD